MKTLLPIFLLIACFSCKPVETENIHLNEFDFIPFEVLNDEMDLIMKETSGIVKDEYTYWTHNDSGNPAVLFQISEDGEIQNRVKLSDYYQKDWEDITTDGTHMYIGDIGNNFGNRKDLRILKLPLDSLASTEAVVRDTINFRFPDQDVFPGDYSHNFDCESLIAFADDLYVFTKNWADHAVRMYKLPKAAGTYDAELVGDFNSKGIISSAAMSPDGSTLALLGYNYSGKMDPFIWLFSEFEGADFFKGKAKRYNLKMQRQTEGIAFMDNDNLIITAEKGQTKAAAIFKVSLN